MRKGTGRTSQGVMLVLPNGDRSYRGAVGAMMREQEGGARKQLTLELPKSSVSTLALVAGAGYPPMS